jgi:hypothetical protein
VFDYQRIAVNDRSLIASARDQIEKSQRTDFRAKIRFSRWSPAWFSLLCPKLGLLRGLNLASVR